MLDLVSNAWKASKVKFLLVAIPVVVMLLAAIFLKAWRSYLVASAKKLLEKTLSKDKQLSAESDKANQEANDHKAKADELGKKADEVKNDDDADWNKKV